MSFKASSFDITGTAVLLSVPVSVPLILEKVTAQPGPRYISKVPLPSLKRCHCCVSHSRSIRHCVRRMFLKTEIENFC